VTDGKIRRVGGHLIGLSVILILTTCGIWKKTPYEPSALRDTTTIVLREPARLPVSRPSTVQLLPSYRGKGGPHLLIDSLNLVIALTPAEVQQVQRASSAILQSYNPDPLVQKESRRTTTRFYATKLRAKDLLANEVPDSIVENQPHFVGTYDEHGQLVALQFFDNQQGLLNPNPVLTVSQATYWDIFFSRPMFFTTEDGVKFPARAKIFRDQSRRIRRVEYQNNTGGTVARGTFYYGLHDVILEQRLEFEGEGRLTDINPFWFDRQFDQIKPGWVAKALYYDNKMLSDLLVMDDYGNQYYRYLLTYERNSEGTIAHLQVRDANDKPVAFSDLLFNEYGRLTKKTNYDHRHQPLNYQLLTIDYEKFRIVVDVFRPDGSRLDRFYTSL